MTNTAAARRRRARTATLVAIPLALGAGVLAHAADPGTTEFKLRAFEDANGNGSWDSGEAGAPGVQVTLTPKAGGTAIGLSSDAYGESTLIGAPGEYTVDTIADTQFEYSVVSGTFGATGTSASYVGADGANQEILIGVVENPDCEATPERCSTISGTVFYDKDTNATLDATDELAGYVVVQLLKDGAVVQTATTDDSGLYTFVAKPGTGYAVRVTPPLGFEISSGPVDVTTGETAVFQAVRGARGFLPVALTGEGTTPENPGGGGDDQTAPVIALSSAPETTTTSKTATFKFTADETVTSWEYVLDQADTANTRTGTFTDGTLVLNNLSVGSHTLDVRATDAQGNVSTPSSYTWMVSEGGDTTAPVVKVVSGPEAVTTSTSATFVLESSEPATSWAYVLDGGTETVFADGKLTLDGLSLGQHTASFAAKDAAGNISESVSVTWSVATAPDDDPQGERQTVQAGGLYTMDGEGFTAGETVTAVLTPGDRVLDTVTADADGKATVTVTIPTDIAPGEYRLAMVGAASGNQVVADLTVEPAASGDAGAEDPAATAADGNAAAGGGDLATTGVEVSTIGWATAILLALGGGGVVLAHRIRSRRAA